MPKLNFSRTVPYKPEQMLDLVSDMASYPHFVPNCSAMDIKPSEKAPDRVCDVCMHMDFGPISQSYTSRVTIDRENMTISVKALDGLFSYMKTQWIFNEIEQGTRVLFKIDFEIANPLLRAVLNPAFAARQGEIIDAFMLEAKRRYG
ncbi:hypothetical protein MNBD_ALPHA12-500 [hydrothermal vent metagenome]|uniref:Coenzyme Q-binding protein COQ10 START domain-containing protein n=1 Tax=hydrothermal vent metagenome TaxID=652676 RepID=A0A3B0TAY9_9ZZZZ